MAPLPPLNGLRAFDAAARHLSFRKAAEELSVTPAAVSQQIRQLEERYGVELFHRLTRAVELTEAGRAAAPAIREGFARLTEGAETLARARPGRVVTVSVAPSFAAKWLLPRLERFRARHPELDMRIDASDQPASFAGDGVDIALRYGRGSYPGLVAECLLSETTFPVCSPALLERGPALAAPEDLRHHTLLHVQWKMEQELAPNWRMWLRAAGATGVDAERGPRFSYDSLAVQAAMEGQGVALAGRALVERDLADGRLIQPFPADTAQATAFSYFVVYPEGRGDEPRVRAFRDWVMEEVGAA